MKVVPLRMYSSKLAVLLSCKCAIKLGNWGSWQYQGLVWGEIDSGLILSFPCLQCSLQRSGCVAKQYFFCNMIYHTWCLSHCIHLHFWCACNKLPRGSTMGGCDCNIRFQHENKSIFKEDWEGEGGTRVQFLSSSLLFCLTCIHTHGYRS